ncbi:MAG: ATP-grasp domain-containing protein [Rubrivivax sp.]|nr:ATP-grasp domain-containing protein [Rubrivivax sp.]
MDSRPRIGALFAYDWDEIGLDRQRTRCRLDRAGFDLFSFPSNARLVGFDLGRFAAAQARRGRRRRWAGVVSNHEQFGALAAALVAERLGLPGTAPDAVLACQHKLHARAVLQRVAPEANLRFAALDADYGDDVPDGLRYPLYVKPVKAAFSVLAREVAHRDELHAHTRFSRRELWVIRRLVEPFERICRERLPEAGSAHRMLLEEPVPKAVPQFNLDGGVFDGQAHALGVVDAIMYPGTQAFMRWELPSRLPAEVQARALDVARRFLAAVGFRHGFFNMEFFHDPGTDRLTVIEFNPRMAAQFSDLYLRVLGLDPHAMAVALALGEDPAALPRAEPSAGAAASFVYRALSPGDVPTMPSAIKALAWRRAWPDGMLFCFPKQGHALERDFKWLGSHRYGIVHLGARDARELRERCRDASAMLGWPLPYAQSPTAPAAGWEAPPLVVPVPAK